MPELAEQMYCSQQIIIPPKFPYILKKYAKAAIKTQPYDLLRWSYEYFRAVADGRAPPVKFRLEYPIYSTEGGLTKGYLKVLANQLANIDDIPLTKLQCIWEGTCLDVEELKRILCLSEVYMRSDKIPRLKFLAVAGGFLTKSLTHTMILLCETLTKEPEGGSAAIPLEMFLEMYNYLADIDASDEVKYFNGYREGMEPEQTFPEEEEEEKSTIATAATTSKKLQEMNQMYAGDDATAVEDKKAKTEEPEDEKEIPIEIHVYDEEDNECDFDVYGEPVVVEITEKEEPIEEQEEQEPTEPVPPEPVKPTEKELEAKRIKEFLEEIKEQREQRIEDLMKTFKELSVVVDRYQMANYDLGMVAGRQMSDTSGEFVVKHIEKDIITDLNELIEVLPDPELKKRKAKPEEVAMIRQLLDEMMDAYLDMVIPEVEEIEEEEQPIPVVTVVYAVPGIGPIVGRDIVYVFEEYAREVAKVQADLFMPRNIRHFLCPPLERYVELDYDKPNEELPTDGAITV